MILENEFTFEGRREAVWDLLHDPEIMANAIPGAKRLVRKDEDHYEGEIKVGVGSVGGVFSLTITLKDKIYPQGFTMIISAKGRTGFVNGKVQVELSEDEAESTLMKYSAEMHLGGKIATVGQRLLDSVGKSMTRRGLKSLNKSLQKSLAASKKSGKD